jgi:hypothetical protein
MPAFEKACETSWEWTCFPNRPRFSLDQTTLTLFVTWCIELPLVHITTQTAPHTACRELNGSVPPEKHLLLLVLSGCDSARMGEVCVLHFARAMFLFRCICGANCSSHSRSQVHVSGFFIAGTCQSPPPPSASAWLILFAGSPANFPFTCNCQVFLTSEFLCEIFKNDWS